MSQDSHDGDVQGDKGSHSELPEITWVGDQRLMSGYCGRAVETPATTTATPAESRPVAVVRRAKRSQGRVVRIGPPRAIRPAAA
jgi:hypothetical protein